MNIRFRACTKSVQALLSYEVIGNARCSIINIDDAPAAEAVLLRKMLHGFIVRMSIEADMTAAAFTIRQASRKDTTAAGRDAMNGTIGRIGAPGTAFDIAVCGIGADRKHEYTADFQLPCHHKQPLAPDILFQKRTPRIAVAPLSRIPVIPHELTRGGVDCFNFIQVRLYSRADFVIFHQIVEQAFSTSLLPETRISSREDYITHPTPQQA